MKHESTPTTHNKRSRSKVLATALAPLLFAVAACAPSNHDAAPVAVASTTAVPRTSEVPTTTIGSKSQETTTTVATKASAEVNQYKVNTVVETLIKDKLTDLPEKIKSFNEGRNMFFQKYPSSGYNGEESKVYTNIFSGNYDVASGSSEIGYRFYAVYTGETPEGRDFKKISLSTNIYNDPATLGDPDIKGYKILNNLDLIKDEKGDWIPLVSGPDGVIERTTDGALIETKVNEFAALLNLNEPHTQN